MADFFKRTLSNVREKIEETLNENSGSDEVK